MNAEERKAMFDPKAVEVLGHYVYALFDPAHPDIPFYIGKGQGNRVFAHAAGDIPDEAGDGLPPKMALIHDIHMRGKQVVQRIVKYELTEDAAFAVEAALIDMVNYIKPESLRNEISGHGSASFIDANDLAVTLQAEPLNTARPVLLIKIDRQWDKIIEGKSFADVSAEDVYRAVRGNWKINVSRAQRADCIAAIARGLVRGVFLADEWIPASDDRVAFNGRPAPEPTWSQFVNKSVVAQFPRGGQNPVRYMSC